MTTDTNDVGGEWGGGNFQIVPEGYYKAVVKTATAKDSKSGNKMIELILNIEHEEYDGVTIYHYLIFMLDADNFNNKKRRWFQESAGMPYVLADSNDSVAKLIINKKLTIKVKTGKKQDGSEQNDICGVHPYTWTDGTVKDKALDLEMDDNFL